jgi:rRNA pseudouridine-1189 N-methylase Emg1 (Nep1/Mra1 family)
MSGEMRDEKLTNLIPQKGDLVICLDTGSLGIILQDKGVDVYIVSFPHGEYSYDLEDFDVLKSGSA